MSDDGRGDGGPHVVHETTVVDGGGGGGGLIALVVLVIVLGIAAFLYFGGYLGGAADKGDINVNVAAPSVDLPDVEVPAPATSNSR